MTYPQGPYGPQDPYNQGGYPQSGGFPQPGGYPQQGGYPPPPPPKSNTALIVSIVAVVVLGALGITGFVAPGFFLSDDEGSSGGGNTSAQSAAQAMVAAINAKDAAGVRGLRCSTADEDLEQVATGLGQIKSAALNGQVQESGTTASVSLQVDVGSPVTTNGQLAKENGTWCWRAFDGESSGNEADGPPAAGAPAGTGAAVKAAAEAFVSSLNSGSASANDQVCVAAKRSIYLAEAIENALDSTTSLRVAGDPNVQSPTQAGVNLEGTIDGRTISSGGLSLKSEDNGATWCVFTLTLPR